MSAYRNPNYKGPMHPEYGPEFYETSTVPVEYRGHLIYNRIPGLAGRGVWDCVKDGICVTQAAGPRGARQLIDQLIERRAELEQEIEQLKREQAPALIGEIK